MMASEEEPANVEEFNIDSDFVVGENPEEEEAQIASKSSRFEASSVLDSFYPVDIKLPSLQ